jgi:hypothetical protein
MADALLQEGANAQTAKERVDALRGAHDLLNGTRRAAIDAQEDFNTGLLSINNSMSKSSNSMSINTTEGIKNRDALAGLKKQNARNCIGDLILVIQWH